VYVIAFAGLAFGEETPSSGNIMCPVMTDMEAIDDYTILHKGKEVRFCCEECQKEFLEDPEPFEAILPQFANASKFEKAQMFYEEYRSPITISLVGALLLGLFVYRKFRTPVPTETDGALGRLWTQPISASVPLLLISICLGWALVDTMNGKQDLIFRDYIHFATFYDFGFPAQPDHPDVGPRLAGTYYRGNDERNDRLFNDGNYRTATFNIALVNADGEELEAGADVGDRELFVKFEIVRPPFTPDFLYEDDLMTQMFLTKQCEVFLGRYEPTADRLALTTTEPMQRWEAVFPIDRTTGTCCEDLTGVIYVCQDHYIKPWWRLKKEELMGARYHYGIKYKLKLKDGRLTPESDLWMNALYRTRKFDKATIPMAQWFSHESIPELPGPNVEDEELLGVDDHRAYLDK
ncbi:MAG: hypothetical protein AB8G99_02795, partial [Planctomycetaceae bacterium]